ncbi:short chain dehydrogenase [Burkholderia sp. FERM BP-3421]|jgi:NAD(P)-dependent dehydrogenase (short-subunit alcohol dehydrogenase family)|uniref:short chain dehydrogenase n=1 Tax=Burkholderia sp. FERM BP-3421 TaxID=1494466 RepID=UPI0023619B00|nr:short chain dehydrogenase [Burkholderia sp. FERM BP-3421]WDD90931.1 short chain dehydrogenase [Burkholderia sp. FERM BP-3421]
MKILIVGASGTLGSAIVNELKPRHEIVAAGRSHGDVRVDLKDIDSVQRMYHAVGPVDAVIAATGSVHFGPLGETASAQFAVGLADKLLGQVNLVLAGQHLLNAGGSFTLTSGVIGDAPFRGGSNAAAVNGALAGFVRNAAVELPRGLRINLVSPTVFEESLDAYGALFRGHEAIPVGRAALAYSRSAEGAETGRLFRVGY